MVVEPALPRAEANPVLLIVATDKSEDDHDTPLVMSVTVPSLNKPVAENCCDDCAVEIVGLLGLISMEVRGELVMVTLVEPLTPSSLAEIVAEPGATAVAIPVSFMKTTPALDVVQTGAFNTPRVPSTKVADAVNCCLKPVRSEGEGGVTAIDAIETCQKSSHEVQRTGSITNNAQRAAFCPAIHCQRRRKE